MLVITDDQGYGDLSLHGNPHLKTPNMDRVGREGAQFTQFHVCPVCSPTRSSLMTGRYNYRTGVVDTYLGRSMMHADETTLAEALRDAGYRTGIFGKWHLGDCAPLRAIDQGFEEALTLRGGGLMQPSDLPMDPPARGYFDPWLEQNGKRVQKKGYITDTLFDAALGFIEQNRTRPFFCYVATNAPHSPYEVGEEWSSPFRKAGLDEQTARIYGMIANLDANIGRLHGQLSKMGLERDTILIFMTDNGPGTLRWNAGMRANKGTVYQGGLRVPFFLRWPARVEAGMKVDRIAAHIDILPTLLDACRTALPRGRKIDGRSLMPLLGGRSAGWADRELFFQWHRGDAPEAWRACAVRNQRWKLVDGKELYDLESDPGEKQDVAAAQREVAARLRVAYEGWFRDVSAERGGFDPPRIWIGSELENPTLLTRQDWRGPRASWNEDGLGHWEVEVRKASRFNVLLRFPALAGKAAAEVEFRGVKVAKEVEPGQTSAFFEGVEWPAGAGRVESRIVRGEQARGPHFVEVTRL